MIQTDGEILASARSCLIVILITIHLGRGGEGRGGTKRVSDCEPRVSTTVVPPYSQLKSQGIPVKTGGLAGPVWSGLTATL